jgi:hypothetical protein
MRVAILQSNYIPWKGYFDLIASVDIFVFLDNVQYTKNDWRNRNILLNKNGPFWLTIPLAKESVKKKIDQVELPQTRWRADHSKSITETYKKSPFFHEIENYLKKWFSCDNSLSLSQFNQNIIRDICDFLQIKTEIIDSKRFHPCNDKIERIFKILNELGANCYISGPSALNYLRPHINLFKQRNISLRIKQYGPYCPYPHYYHTFQHNVSIVDLLANCDPSERQDKIRSDSYLNLD